MFGPMAKLGWGTPTLITITFGADRRGAEPGAHPAAGRAQGDRAGRRARPAAPPGQLPRRHRLRAGAAVPRRLAVRLPAARLHALGRHGGAVELGRRPQLPAHRRRLPPGVPAAAGRAAGAAATHRPAARRRQPAAHPRDVLRGHVEHRPVRRAHRAVRRRPAGSTSTASSASTCCSSSTRSTSSPRSRRCSRCGAARRRSPASASS